MSSAYTPQDHPSSPVERPPRFQTTLLYLVFIGFTITAILLIFRDPSNPMPWGCLFFFGPGIPMFWEQFKSAWGIGKGKQQSARSYALMMGLCCVSMGIGSGLIALLPEPMAKIIGVLGAAFFGLGGLVLLFKSIHGDATLLVKAEGLRIKGQLYPWSNISGYWVSEIQGTHFLCLSLFDRTTVAGRVAKSISRMNRGMGYGDVSIALSLSDFSAEQLLDILDYRVGPSRPPCVE